MSTDVKEVAWRSEFYKTVQAQRDNDVQTMKDSIYREQMKALNIYSVKDVAQYFGYSYSTAYNQMRNQIIPSFQIGARWFTHDYILEQIRRRAIELVESSDYVKRSYPRMVFKYDAGKIW